MCFLFLLFHSNFSLIFKGKICHWWILTITMQVLKWSESHSGMCDSLWPQGLYSPRNSPGQNIGVGSLSLLQEIFPTQGSNPGLPHRKQILYQLSHKGSLRILEWITYPFSSGSSWLRNWTWVSCIAGGFFTNWANREIPMKVSPWAKNVWTITERIIWMFWTFDGQQSKSVQ